jgi:hypothetical protein
LLVLNHRSVSQEAQGSLLAPFPQRLCQTFSDTGFCSKEGCLGPHIVRKELDALNGTAGMQ